MKTFFDEIKLSSNKEFEPIDITKQVKECVKKSGITDGFVIVFSPHTTGGVRVCESERGLMHDYAEFFEKIAPRNADYMHNKTDIADRPNGYAHLQTLIVNSGEAIPLRNGEMLLGRWQTIFFVEFDGARPARKVIVEVVG